MKFISFNAALVPLFFIFTAAPSFAQTIRLTNPSFEDFPGAAQVPSGWTDCGFPDETPADTQPNGAFYEQNIAKQGNTYLGMVARDNKTWESVSQQLSSALDPTKAYDFSLFLSHSDTYKSQTKQKVIQAFDGSLKLRIWGGNSPCDKAELLSESAPVGHTAWKLYEFRIKPKRKYSYIVFEAFYKNSENQPYCGNLFVDDCSPFIPIPEEEPIIASQEDIKPHIPKKETPKNPVAVKEPDKKEPKTINDLTTNNVAKGQTFRMENLQFKADSTSITSINTASFAELDRLASFLLKNPTVKVEISGHTNSNCDDDICNKLSFARAQTVANYLIRKGANPAQMVYIGKGKKEPIASNNTPEGRKTNQRVQIKITDI